MPSPTVTLDSVEGTAADVNVISAGGTITRGGWVDGIDENPDTFLAQVMVAVNAVVPPGTPYPGTNLPYWRLQAKPTPSGTSASVILIYTLEGSGTISAYVISTRSYLATIETNMILATGEQLFVDWTDPDSGVSAPRDTVRDRAQVPFREVTVNGITIGTPDYEKYEGYTWYVNADQWRNRGPGFWLLVDGGVDASQYAGSYGWHLSAVTRNGIDWSEVRDRKNPATGITLPVKKADQQTVANAPYKQGVIAKVNGRIRYAQYPMTSFVSLFGWGGAGGHQIPDTRSPIAPPDTSGVASNT